LVLRGTHEPDGAFVLTWREETISHDFFVLQKQNFLRDQSGMKQQLLTLQQLISVMDPELYRHFEKTDGLNLFFCFRCTSTLYFYLFLLILGFPAQMGADRVQTGISIRRRSAIVGGPVD